MTAAGLAGCFAWNILMIVLMVLLYRFWSVENPIIAK